MRSITRFYGFTVALAALCLVVLGTAVQAQGDGGQGDLQQTRNQAGDLDRDRDRDQDQTQQYTKDQVQIRNRLHDRINASAGLSAEERAAMHANADACVDLDIPEADLDALFPGEENRHRISAQTMLRLQNRVMTAAREGLPVEPVVAKIQEGRTKGVPDALLEKACVRMENNVRTAHQIMKRAVDEGFVPPGDQTQTRHMNTEMAQQMWRGMNEEGYEQLRERARVRARDGQCGVEDLVSAGELTTRLMEAGVNRERATRFSGDALQKGYRAQEMRQLELVVAARAQRGEPMNGFMGDMEHCVGAGMQAGEMFNYMMRHGWMGPGDMYGPGGYQPTDSKGLGGHQGQGGGHGGHGGGSDDGSGGM
jgi:hypothetical protein